MPRLSEIDRHRALGLFQAGLPISEVSLRMNVNRMTLFRIKRHLHEADTVSNRPRSGRPRSITQRQDRNLVRNHMNNRFLSASASSRQTRGRNNQRISVNTEDLYLPLAYVLVAHTSAPSYPSVTDTNVRYGPRNMPCGIASYGEVSYSVTNLDSALTMLMAVYVYGEKVVKDTKQIALGNTAGGVEYL
ncbi:transposable element Tcb2 transposase [Elysia marginata]|uniref:Transposable element Tcb2 transposase n=1 Tax=Elysia marginata TaxID=1093978 RepID=A0AAV4IET5_9GAST|nr:transposable element Tcb2 transposase [Elysia marginata]